MAISATYYLDSPSLGTATVIYSDSNLTTVANDGYYSDGIISRQQLDGVLLPQQTCPSCAPACGIAINASGGQGIYLVDLETGSTVTDVGAIIIRFDPQSVPDGIRATLNTTVYNKLVSPADGLHQAPSGSFVYVGQISSDCGIAGTTYPALPEFQFDGTSFISTGNTQSITVSPISVSLGVNPPGYTMMVVPKLSPTPSMISIEVVGPCAGTAWDMSVECPALLTGFDSSLVEITSTAVCLLDETVIYYNASLAGTSGIVGLYDLVFLDAYGFEKLPEGFYLASGSVADDNDWFEVDADGVVVDLGLCTLNIYGGDVWFGLAPSTGLNNACNEGAPQQYLYWKSNNSSFKNGIKFFTDAACTTAWVNSSSYLYCRSDGSGGGFAEFNLSGNTVGVATGTVC